jgi:hypothetical protein
MEKRVVTLVKREPNQTHSHGTLQKKLFTSTKGCLTEQDGT